MKNQKDARNNRPVPQAEDTSPKNAQDEMKEPSVLDKLKDQIKKIKELKEKRPGNFGDDLQ